MFKSFSKLSIGAKFALTASALVLVAFGVLALLMSMTMTRYLDQEAMDELSSTGRQMQDLVQVFDGALDKDVGRVAKEFASYFPERIELERGNTVKIGELSTPVLRAGAERINLNFDRVDAFTARSGATATVFARSGRDFVRVATSLKKEDGSRAIGTVLDHEHPGYKQLLEGRAYRGPAVLFGRNYMTSYEPIRDNDGQVIGVLYVGIDISQDMEVLKQKIRAVKLRQTGYFYVLDVRPGANLGTAIIHPKAEGSNLLGYKDASGREVMREMLEKKQGVLRYVLPSTRPAWRGRDNRRLHILPRVELADRGRDPGQGSIRGQQHPARGAVYRHSAHRPGLVLAALSDAQAHHRPAAQPCGRLRQESRVGRLVQPHSQPTCR